MSQGLSQNIMQKVEEFRRKQPGFFEPYKDKKDVFNFICQPIVSPLILGVIGAILPVVSCAAMVASVACLLSSPVLLPFSKEKASSAFNLAVAAGAVALLTAAFTPLAAILAVALIPGCIAWGISRGVATFVKNQQDTPDTAPQVSA